MWTHTSWTSAPHYRAKTVVAEGDKHVRVVNRRVRSGSGKSASTLGTALVPSMETHK